MFTVITFPIPKFAAERSTSLCELHFGHFSISTARKNHCRRDDVTRIGRSTGAAAATESG
jgi:hypothetical protein